MLDEERACIRSLAANVRALRRSRGLTQEQLAEVAGLDLKSLQRIEAATTNTTVAVVARLATALGARPGRLLRRATLPAPTRGRPLGS